ncbi:MAG: hypothetical protein K9M84_06495 [Spirochaetia bacterium]|nr:hypothetical protein [Spirochaetia bacterium]
MMEPRGGEDPKETQDTTDEKEQAIETLQAGLDELNKLSPGTAELC